VTKPLLGVVSREASMLAESCGEIWAAARRAKANRRSSRHFFIRFSALKARPHPGPLPQERVKSMRLVRFPLVSDLIQRLSVGAGIVSHGTHEREIAITGDGGNSSLRQAAERVQRVAVLGIRALSL